ncbi:MAG: ribosome recycling factor [Saccharospirillum sp.]|nr:ribosome recycling factor [Saccharospirillum sp.]
MIEEIKQEVEAHNRRAIAALDEGFNKIRTGRANPSILDSVMVNYYGSDTQLKQVANINVEDGRTLAIVPWERNLIPDIERAIMKADLGLNPATSGEKIRVVMPALTEESRKEMIKVARSEAEKARVSIRSGRRDANDTIKELVKEKELSEDEGRRAEDDVQKLTDKAIAKVEEHLESKEKELLTV